MIVLIGFMGAGKTTVGRLLASMTGRPFIDTDEEVEAHAGRTIPEIFESDGELAFRALERERVGAALAAGDAILAVGGGAVGDPQTRNDLGRYDVVHLDVGFAEAMRRAGDPARRPMLLSGDRKALYDDRREIYGRLARVTVSTDGKSPERVAAEVAHALGLDVSHGLRRIAVDVPDRYDVVVGRGLIDRLGEHLPPLPGAEAAFVVSHPSLDALSQRVRAALEDAGLRTHLLAVPEGEGAKSLERASDLYTRLAAAPAHRRDVLVGVGGGVVSDLTAFVASTYNRGMPTILVPTTLLGQVDAAIGGKTGINLPAGKNLVGTIHQPRLVACDVDVLGTLPDIEFASGLAEVAKYGFIEDPELLDDLLRNDNALWDRDVDLLVDVIARSVAIKASIVSKDERESGLREILNYGHTFGHAIEHSHSFSLRHGHAVALGMMAAAYLALELRRIDDDVVARHAQVLKALRLPVQASLDINELDEAWVRDKKYRGGVRFVLLAELGKAEAGISAPRDAIVRALERMEK